MNTCIYDCTTAKPVLGSSKQTKYRVIIVSVDTFNQLTPPSIVISMNPNRPTTSPVFAVKKNIESSNGFVRTNTLTRVDPSWFVLLKAEDWVIERMNNSEQTHLICFWATGLHNLLASNIKVLILTLLNWFHFPIFCQR